jgi:hypothetical protein
MWRSRGLAFQAQTARAAGSAVGIAEVVGMRRFRALAVGLLVVAALLAPATASAAPVHASIPVFGNPDFFWTCYTDGAIDNGSPSTTNSIAIIASGPYTNVIACWWPAGTFRCAPAAVQAACAGGPVNPDSTGFNCWYGDLSFQYSFFQRFQDGSARLACAFGTPS